jgi:hypothetical protein
MTPYKEFLGIQDSNLSDQEIITRLERAQVQGKTNVEFVFGRRKVFVSVPFVHPAGIEENQNT